MGSVERRLQELGLELPPEPVAPPNVQISFSWARVVGSRVFLSGHGALTGDGKPAGPFGKVPSTVSADDARTSARGAGLAMLGSLRRAIGDLDRVSAWVMVHGLVNADAGYSETTNVVNGCSELLLDVFGHEVGHHARTAAGVAALPLDYCVVVAAEVELHP